MTFRNQLGSASALSLAASPAGLITAAAAAGVTVTVAAAVFAYEAYESYVAKKHEEEIRYVNSLHEKYLKNIVINDAGGIKGFPAIFKFPNEKDTSKVEYLLFPDNEIETMGDSLPYGIETELAEYRQEIRNAILKLKEYYFSRKERQDVKAIVISYLMYMLEKKCLNFEGYDYDIAYLNAIIKFTNEYASKDGSEKTKNFDRLDEVHRHLREAKQSLEYHKEHLSLTELICNLKDSSLRLSEKLIRNFVKLVSKDYRLQKQWHLADLATLEEISEGILTKKHIKLEIKHVVLMNDSKTEISKSIFKKWCMTLANYYRESIKPDTHLTTRDILPPSQVFTLPNLNRLDELINTKRRTKQENEEMKELNDTFCNVRHNFKECETFIALKLDPKSKDEYKLIPVSENNELIERAKILADFAALIHEIISLQYLCMHLMKSIKQLGEIKVKNPHHFTRVFRLLDELCNHIRDNIKTVKKSFMDIQKANQNVMMLAEKEQLPNTILDVLGNVDATVSDMNTRIKDYRDRAATHLNNDEPTLQSVKHEMFEVMTLISTIYNIDKQPTYGIPAAPTAAASSLPAPDEGLTDSANSLKNPTPSSSTAHLNAEIAPSSIPTTNDHHLTQKLNSINSLLADIYNTINHIQINDKPKEDDKLAIQNHLHFIRAYQQLRLALIGMQKKSEALVSEINPSNERMAKINKTLDLTILLCEMTFHYLNLNLENRINEASRFNQQIQLEINHERNKFIDDHTNGLKQNINSITHLGIFKTNSRSKLLAILSACTIIENLARNSMPKLTLVPAT